MNDTPENSQKSGTINHWVKESITIRLIVVGFIAVLLLIPLFFAGMLIEERGSRKQQVIEKINRSWGTAISLQGPMLKVPYRISIVRKLIDPETKEETREVSYESRHLYFFPDSLDISAKAETRKRAYGIFESILFESDIQLSGHFGKLEYDSVAIPPESIDWNRASIVLYSSSLKGIQEVAQIDFGGREFDFKPVYKAGYEEGQMETRTFNMQTGLNIPFNMHLKMNGSEFLEFVPVGKITRVRIESDWHSPGFTGEFLPEEEGREISSEGFSSQWQVLEINRNFGQTFTSEPPKFGQSAMRTEFVVPVDDYQKVTRTSKYGFLVISLTLFTFLIIQLTSKRYIHPLQYFLIGLALVTFYTLLLSITEHSDFLTAYLIAGGAVILLITIYAVSVLKSIKTSTVVFFCLLVLYAFIYVIIQLEDYALLVGSIGTFLILATIMFVTRNLEWNLRDSAP